MISLKGCSSSSLTTVMLSSVWRRLGVGSIELPIGACEITDQPPPPEPCPPPSGVGRASISGGLSTPVCYMDAPAIYRQNHGVRRTLLWSLLAVVAAVYLPVAVWGVSAGLDDASNLIWAFVIVPSFVGAGVILMVKRPGHPIGELLLACGIALWAIPTILEISTQVIFQRSEPRIGCGRRSGCSRPSPTWVSCFSPRCWLSSRRPISHARERRFLLAAWVVVAFPTLVMVSNRLMLTDELSFAGVSGIPSPLFVEALEPYGEAFDVLNTLGFSIVVGAIALLFMRYRSAPTRERKQIRWVLLAGVMAILLGSIGFVLPEFGVIPPPGHEFSVLMVSA